MTSIIFIKLCPQKVWAEVTSIRTRHKILLWILHGAKHSPAVSVAEGPFGQKFKFWRNLWLWCQFWSTTSETVCNYEILFKWHESFSSSFVVRRYGLKSQAFGQGIYVNCEFCKFDNFLKLDICLFCDLSECSHCTQSLQMIKIRVWMNVNHRKTTQIEIWALWRMLWSL